MQVWAIILAAGQSSRLAQAGITQKKQFLTWNGAPLFWQSARTLAGLSALRGLVFVFPPAECEAAEGQVAALDRRAALGLPWRCLPGGARRQDSVANGLAALPEDCDTVLVHDAARPFFSAALACALLDALAGGAVAAIPAVPVKDTVKQVAGDQVLRTLPRDTLRAVQTPQAFQRCRLDAAHAMARGENWDVTDDAALLERMGDAVYVVPGEEANVKITTLVDLELLRPDSPALMPCVGWGYDVHRYARGEEGGRAFKLGGVAIPKAPSIIAHSDGDVLLHALTDAILGCLGQGDIGQRFPDTDPSFENMNSAIFLNETLHAARQAGLQLTHVDLTIVAQTPKIAPWREQIRDNLARLLGLARWQVNVKATTEEGLGFTGEKRGIKAVAAVTGLRPAPPDADEKTIAK